MYCSFCGSGLPSQSAFCNVCGKNINFRGDINVPSASQGGNIKQEGALESFRNFRVLKEERRLCFKKRKEPEKNPDNPVKISIGVMRPKCGVLSPVRGMTLPISVKPRSNAKVLQNAALQKLQAFNKSFPPGPYFLLYPDGSKILNIPGRNIPFSVRRYKEAVGKAYQRITVYICTEKDFMTCSEEITTDSEKSDPEVIVMSESVKEFNAADTVIREPAMGSTSDEEESHPDTTTLELVSNSQKDQGTTENAVETTSYRTDSMEVDAKTPDENQPDVRKDALSTETPPPLSYHDYCVPPLTPQEQLDAARKHIIEQDKIIAELKGKEFRASRFQCDDNTISFYTGFPDYATFNAVYMALQPTAISVVGWSQTKRFKQQTDEQVLRQGFSISKLATIDQFFLFLCRLRQGFTEEDLAVRFSVSQSTVRQICVTWADYLYFILGSLPIWPSKSTVDQSMPTCFRNTYPDTRVILDCTEIYVQTPSSKVLNSKIYSHYKSNPTFKGLIGIAPSGEVSFVSDLYTGSISDKEIIELSGILSILEEGDLVMADKRFLIKDMLSKLNVSLVTPPFLGPSGTFSADKVTETQTIARLRIHVERAIRRVKEFHIFDDVIPMTMIDSVNQCWAVCAMLTNFQGPLF